ncbi:hypothetical protein I203_107704 [Kwoniella mangroviensis CBS 8507]|uniref:hypothetical protein n=1 Tax=Kwoniella mangroviensis CBS 8507 TaxID=1296122 RepID=UPI00080D79D8|nr:uncharacterized protein I203_02453 [Kwoniella mangroviensis CBS 8507]OCF69057.1 hypothetical protein I203_02453 [Kwoniella mangroviensis CBS 8507]
MTSEGRTTPYGRRGIQTHYSAAGPVTLRPTGDGSSGTTAQELPSDPVSSIFYWSVDTTNLLVIDKVSFDHVTWYGTNIDARREIDQVARECTKSRDLNWSCYMASTHFYSGKDEEWAISQDIISAYEKIATECQDRNQRERDPEAEDISRFFWPKQNDPTTIQDIRRIKGQLEEAKNTPPLANGLLVLGTTTDPMKSGTSWIGTSAEEAITDFKVLVSPDESNGLFYKHKKSILDNLGNTYWSRKVSNDLPSYTEACLLAEEYTGCEVIKVWDKTLEEMQALERVTLTSPINGIGRSSGEIVESLKDSWDW